MKTRSGFVSNSSSSSFIIATKTDDPSELNVAFKRALTISSDSPLHELEEKIISTFLDKIECTYTSIKEYEKDNFCCDRDDIKKLLERGYIVQYGYMESSSSNLIETFFSNHSLNYTDDEVIIIHDGSY